MRAGVPSMFFRIGVYEPERVAAARISIVPSPAHWLQQSTIGASRGSEP
jgi:hypothetical protein